MQRRRCVRAVLRAALAAAALLGAADAAAQVVPVRIYPLDASALKKADAGDAQALFESGFARFERRARSFVPADPLVLRRSCGARTSIDCLARLAGPGLVLTGSVTQAGGMLSFTLLGVDASGRVHGPVRVGIDAFISSAEPIARALLDLESRVELGPAPAVAQGAPAPRKEAPGSTATLPRTATSTSTARADSATARPTSGTAPGAGTAPTATPTPPASAPTLVTGAGGAPAAAHPAAPTAPRSDAVATRHEAPAGAKDALGARPGAPAKTYAVVLPPPPVLREPPPDGLWLAPTGKWVAATGLGLLAAGAAAGLVGKRMSDSLDAKYRDRSLAGADLSAYDRVDKISFATNALLVAGGVATAGGLALWAVAPIVAPAHGGAQVGVSGRF